jgi:hypothetical protein
MLNLIFFPFARIIVGMHDLLKRIMTCIERGADINQTDTNQKNAIQLLCENYNAKDFMQIMACIIQNGFDIKKHNSSVLRCVLDSSMDRSQQDEVLRLLTRYGIIIRHLPTFENSVTKITPK